MRIPCHIIAMVIFSSGAVRSQSVETSSPSLDTVLNRDALTDIAERNPKAEVYRLTVERSFGPVLVFEIEQQVLNVRKVRLIENQEMGKFMTSYRLVRNSDVRLESEEFANFKALLEASLFWDLPTEEWMEAGMDGSSWTLEGVKAGKYHAVKRSSPLTIGPQTPLGSDVKRLAPERALLEGRLVAAFVYLWGLAGDSNEKLY